MIYLISNRHLLKNTFESMLEDGFKGGVDRFILREKDLPFEDLLDLAKIARKLSNDYKRKLIINGNIGVAEEVGADGIQLSYSKFMDEKINYEGLIGVSCHSLEEAKNALEKGADYVFVSHVFQTNCKKDLPPKGIDFVREILEDLGSEKIVPLGGINLDNQMELRKIGAKNIGVMSEIVGADDPFKVASEFKEYF